MDDFAAHARAAMKAKGISLRAAARALSYDPAYLSRVLNGKQRPGEQIAKRLDAYLGTEGRLISLALSATPEINLAFPEAEGDVLGEIARTRDAMRHLLEHDNRHGGNTVAPVAVQTWREGMRRLDSGAIPEKYHRPYLALVAELAEIAGWMLFDAGKREASRSAFLESHMLARQAGDRPMQWFALDMIAMLGVHHGSPGEPLRIAKELPSHRVPPRVALLANMRSGRALAQTGDRRRALSRLRAARGALDDSIHPRDPAWSWWVNECEVSGHEGEAHLSLGEPSAAIPHLQRALELAHQSHPGGRGAFYYNVSLLSAFTQAQAWNECGSTLADISPLLPSITSERIRRRLRTALQDIIRNSATPVWLFDLAREVNTANP
ncbi:hypothetical protein GCM10027168_08670 [Streptomyces capparidis]